MSDKRSAALQYAHQNQSRFLEELNNFLVIPTISTSPENRQDMHHAAAFLAERLRTLGMEHVTVYQTSGHPVVYADSMKAGSGKPIVLIYGHYDVQPVDPLDLWQTPPFTPTTRGDDLFARGASDMKGQVMASIAAVDAIIHNDTLPINIKFLLEGEEEIGSPNLDAFIAAHTELLACDLALNPDGGMIAADVPTIIYTLRGLAYFELRIYGPAHDLHSGVFGGVVHNPAQVLCDLVSGMHDSTGHITLPRFYDKVRPLSEEERQELARLPMDSSYYLTQTGVPKIWGESGYSPAECIGARPTLEINGLLSGFTGKGAKTVIPAWAMAKISMRLVADQDPAEVYQQLHRYLAEHAPETVRWEVEQMTGGPACYTDRNSPGVQALSLALEAVWGARPVYKREGGSVPVVASMQKLLGADSVITGFGLPDDNIHAPNEHLHLPTWYQGIDALIHFLYNLADGSRRL
jgi:acetylornithine deacetylase/succinyl-diaminopimelate desuccinylase-like protein